MADSKSTNLQIEERVQKTYELILMNSSRIEIIQYGTGAWNVSPRQIDKYIARAKELLSQDCTEHRETLLIRHIRQRRQIYKRAMGSRNYGAALAAIQDEAKLFKLYGITEQEAIAELQSKGYGVIRPEMYVQSLNAEGLRALTEGQPLDHTHFKNSDALVAAQPSVAEMN